MTSMAAKVAVLKGQVAKLQTEIDQITNSPQYKAEVEFMDKLNELLGDYGAARRRVSRPKALS